ncbi:unnamed protein product [Paramecium pentaurelia]|uniref:Uncharacterized protein n=1 Tax=Paramecium pentaurelia TaxID=43138 RepID=A0A8S1UUV8_9CILI|nr:unnamed protein product [Paramecium pentaurelia]
MIFLKKQHLLQQLACFNQYYFRKKIQAQSNFFQIDQPINITIVVHLNVKLLTQHPVQDFYTQLIVILQKLEQKIICQELNQFCRKWFFAFFNPKSMLHKDHAIYYFVCIMHQSKLRLMYDLFIRLLFKWMENLYQFFTNNPQLFKEWELINEVIQWITLTDDIIIQIFVRPIQINQFRVVVLVHVQNVQGFKLMISINLMLVIIKIRI